MFICLIKLLFYNIFIESFDYESIVLGSIHFFYFINNLAIVIPATLIYIKVIKFIFLCFLDFVHIFPPLYVVLVK